MADRDLSYIDALRSHAEIGGVLWTVDEGLNERFSRDEAVALERRAIEIGGPPDQVRAVIANIRARQAHG